MEDTVCIIPKEILEKLNELLAYNWKREADHFEETYDLILGEDEEYYDIETDRHIDPNKGEYKDHIFSKMLAIDKFIQRLDKPENKNGRLVFSEVLDEPVKCSRCGESDRAVYHIFVPGGQAHKTEKNLCRDCFNDRMLLW